MEEVLVSATVEEVSAKKQNNPHRKKKSLTGRNDHSFDGKS
jgi:hypothetical protein